MSVRDEVKGMMSKRLAVLEASYLARIDQGDIQVDPPREIMRVIAELADIQGQAILKLASEIDKLAKP